MFPIEKTSNKFIAALGRKFAIVTWDGKSGIVSSVDIICEIDTEPEFAMNRLNGGKVDPYGRLWAGNTSIKSMLHCNYETENVVLHLMVAL